MAVRPTSLRVVAAPAPARAQLATTVRVAPARAAAPVGGFENVDGYKNAVVKAVAGAQLAQKALEDAGHAFNDGAGTQDQFEAARAEFKAAIDGLKSLYVAGHPFNTGFFHFGGFKLDKFFKASGAQALIDYVPPTLGGPTPPAVDTFKLKLDAAKQAADDTVNPEPALTELLKGAGTRAQVEQILDVGREGYKSYQGSSYRTACSEALFRAAYQRLAAIEKPTTLDAKLALIKAEANDAVNPEKDLTALLAEAKTEDDVKKILDAGRHGHRDFLGGSYFTAASPVFFGAAYDRLAAITKPATLDAQLALIKRESDDAVNVEADLTALLSDAKTESDVEKLLAAGRRGSRDFQGGTYYTAASTRFFGAAYDRLGAITQPATVDAQLALLKRAANDTVNPEAGLTKLMASATTEAEVNRLLDVGRKGYKAYQNSSYATSLSGAFFAAGHTRLLQLELQATATAVAPADRVKFALQPLPAFESRDGYRNYAVKAASYALVDLQAVVDARQAFAAGAITERELKNAEDGLELSLKLVDALQKAVSPSQAAQWRAQGFDVAGFWSQYAIAETAKAALG